MLTFAMMLAALRTPLARGRKALLNDALCGEVMCEDTERRYVELALSIETSCLECGLFIVQASFLRLRIRRLSK